MRVKRGFMCEIFFRRIEGREAILVGVAAEAKKLQYRPLSETKKKGL